MRLSLILSAAALAVSAAAIAQVANTPAEQKIPNAIEQSTPGNDMLLTDNSLAAQPPQGPATEGVANGATEAPANAATPNPDAPDGDPVDASSKPPAG